MFSIAFGVILPLLCLGVEYTCGFCRGAFFDPMPSWFHVGMIMYVAYANGWLLFRVNRPDFKPLKSDALIIGISIGISLIYALRFMPLIPAGFMSIIVFGIGLLTFGPLMSMFVGIGLARRLSSNSRTLYFGVFAGVLCVFLCELPHSFTRQALQRAMSADPLEARRGVNALLAFGSQNELLRFCYSDKPQISDFQDVFMPRRDYIDPMKARKIFYRVTGMPFNREKFPQEEVPRDDTFLFQFDPDVAGDQVGGRVKGLSLKNSELKITCDPNSASADLEWTLVFENLSNQQAEARTNIALPPSAVVSDLTLWINDVPQSAAFGSKSKTRSAYQSVVARRRDPVLVTSAGGDRVLLQCFPVPVQGTMKTRVRISSPLAIDRDTATLTLPRLIENNFDIFDYMKTTVSSTSPIEKMPHTLVADNKAGLYAAKGVIEQSKFNSYVEPIVFKRDVDAPPVSKIFTAGKVTNVLTQRINAVHEQPVDNVVIVLDGSRAMRPFIEDVSQALSSISDTLPWSIVLASDEVSSLTPEDSLYKQLTPKVVAKSLSNLKFQGGPDNASALVAAARLAARKEGTRILWIHGPQPVIADNFADAIGADNWQPPTIYTFEVESGPNIVAEQLSSKATFKTVPRYGTVKQDLTRIIKQLDCGADVFVPERTVAPLNQTRSGVLSDKAHGELIKLWAYDQVLAGLARNDTAGATKIATTYRIVTPVSGAVVLETSKDFENAGLKQKQDPTKTNEGTSGEPVFEDETEVPAVPEPEMWLLLFVVSMLLFLRLRSNRVRLPWRN